MTCSLLVQTAESLRDFRYKILNGVAQLPSLSRIGGIAQ